MKKLNLKNLDKVEALTRSQLKQVIGGIVVPTCTDKCSSSSDCPDGYECASITYSDGAKCNGCVQNEY